MKFTTGSILATILAGLFTFNHASANIVGAGTQNFNPTTDGLDYVTVQSSKTLPPGVFNLGGFYNYAVNSLPYVDSGVQSRAQLNDSLTSTDFNIGVGLLPYLSVGLSAPSVLSQSVDQRAGVRGDFSSLGNTEIRANAKVRFAKDDAAGYAAVLSVNIPRTRNDPFAGTDPGLTYNVELVADREFSRLLASAINVGYRLRNPGAAVASSFIQPMRNQFIFSAATSYLFETIDTKLIGEIFGAVPAQSQGTNESRNMTSAEMLIGLKHDINNHLAVHAGAGTELIQGISSPDYRLYAGLNYTFGPVWNTTPAIISKHEVQGVAEPLKRRRERFSIGTIVFDVDSDVLLPVNDAIMSELASELKRHPFKVLVIEGHTDSTGSDEHNKDLSLRRANSIRKYLVEKGGIATGTIETVGFGPSQPVASNGNYQGRQENRRVEFTIER